MALINDTYLLEPVTATNVSIVHILSIFLSDDAAICLQYMFSSILCPMVFVFGVGANITNIICFVDQGFKDSVNISLLGLAVSDIGCLSTMVWTNICCTPAFMAADLTFDPLELHYLTSGVPHTVFTRITGCLTAFITMERCLCIIAPLKIKSLLSPRRVTYITVIIFLLVICGVIQEYVVQRLGMKFFPERNKTLIGLISTEERESVAKWSYIINNVLIPFTSFAIISICTMTLVSKLRSNTEWRMKSSHSVNADKASFRNQKVSKLVVTIAILFMVCFIPISITFLAISLEPELFLLGKYKNLVVVIGGIGMFFEAINSSVNIFIYYRMSSKYRDAFSKICKRCH